MTKENIILDELLILVNIINEYSREILIESIVYANIDRYHLNPKNSNDYRDNSEFIDRSLNYYERKHICPCSSTG